MSALPVDGPSDVHVVFSLIFLDSPSILWLAFVQRLLEAFARLPFLALLEEVGLLLLRWLGNDALPTVLQENHRDDDKREAEAATNLVYLRCRADFRSEVGPASADLS